MKSKNNADVAEEKIRKEIEGILYGQFCIPEEFPLRENDNFFGVQGLFGPRELTYLTYMLETQYGIQFSQKEYDSIEFYSISGLSEIVAQKLTEDCGVSV